jgi:hypothetical protein
MLTNIFNRVTNSFDNLIKNLNTNICRYTYTDDKQILNALNIIHQKIDSFIRILDENIYDKINSDLDIEKEEEIIFYISLVTYLIILFITIIPFISILILLFHCKFKQLSKNHFQKLFKRGVTK